ncbi:MAG: Aspartate/glutamate/uridylate kinase [Candidatus Woesebacteria bacterium GW2011_GWA1_37_8]|uniref:Isopentenyl phosphate kinase n=2 Tax=Candidatus Woeseibacteriota TaxID=1752722 RepID=A0A0G0PEJ1_9BACT|nr:MAG: Aspartate/glutamate/uridylate kinase [Microgenomates group bacterium GW2011_GWC1_37_12b]KKQ45854.1 MAG: Aspartate/glutamate/uridylate kinase [Candidatus Woesebacteria bacterium GW2011_GWA1_37_8]KKQ87686.1 MAG: Aspartate/glutamate/uridylate kinase [Candidatus Woesebacteria bacterium GW2011_GWB1_38_8b]
MAKNIKVLKIGGSVVTYKNKDSALNVDVVKSIAKDISLWLKESRVNKLILVSGAGSFGHPLAHKFNLNSSKKIKSNIGFTLTTTNMQKMSIQIAEIFHKHKVPLFPIMPSSVFLLKKRRIEKAFTKNISEGLNRGLLPFLWGDTVIDSDYKFSILSGDQITPYIMEGLKINELYFGTNVNGIYDNDPNKNTNAVHIPDINDSNYKSVLKLVSHSGDLDVTGGMRGKLEEIFKIKTRPLSCHIFNALAKGSVYKALTGEDIGTKIIFLHGEK